MFNWFSKRINYIDKYDAETKFFVVAPVDAKTGEVLLYDQESSFGPGDATPRGTPYIRFVTPPYPTDNEVVFRCRATRLLLVVICLEVTDIIFAVDSVSAIVAQIPDLYLAYTACVFAMLGLRAMFFVIDELVKLFSLLKYGVGLILCFIGVKLLLKGYVYFPPMLVSGILFATLATSTLASVVYEKYFATEEDK